ncbi:hypothetical protein BDM02DRAFT_3128165 [Thelephora ganbajun]|uniref:Uncharacterized protein n=1 Tax=Thelephora ganbajun TaxID=370292 RepID=A0ACB6ZK19_THEGA|nr:hypothetical protein BDM02DRAFT_3128165 [Thelephora ganbajun]
MYDVVPLHPLTTPCGSKSKIHPPPPPPAILSPLINNPNQEYCSPSPLAGFDNFNGEDPPPNDLNPPPGLDKEVIPPFNLDSDSDKPPLSDDEDDPHITLESMKTNLQFVQMIEEATLEAQFSPTELHAFQNPQELWFSPSDDPDLSFSISFFISTLDHLQSQKAYTSTCKNIQEWFPKSEMLSYNQAKQ